MPLGLPSSQGDVFFGTKEPIAAYPEMEEAIAKHAKANKLQCPPEFLLKAVQLYEMTTVRHGMMVVGPSTNPPPCRARFFPIFQYLLERASGVWSAHIWC